MDVSDLKRFRVLSDGVCELLGPTHHKAPIPTETISRLNARRSIVTTKALSEGHKLTESDITYKRPGTGISPLFWDDVLGKTITVELPADHIMQWSDLN